MSVSNAVIIDLTTILNNPEVDFKINFTWQCGNILPYADCEIAKSSFDGICCYAKPDVEIIGKITIDFSALCDKCGGKVVSSIVLDFDQLFVKQQTDDDEYIYSGSRLDLTKALEDEILLSAPTTLLCKEDCKGVCLSCGADLNIGSCDCK